MRNCDETIPQFLSKALARNATRYKVQSGENSLSNRIAFAYRDFRYLWAGEVVILDLAGKITIGEGSVQLRDAVEKLLENVPAHMQSLNMLIVTEGRERTAEQYAALARKAGFSTVESRRTGTPLDATLAIK